MKSEPACAGPTQCAAHRVWCPLAQPGPAHGGVILLSDPFRGQADRAGGRVARSRRPDSGPHGRTVWRRRPRRNLPNPGRAGPAATPDERLRRLHGLARRATSPSTSTPGPPSSGSFPARRRFAEGDANAPLTGARLRPSDGACALQTGAVRLRHGHRPGGVARHRRAVVRGHRLVLRLRADVRPEPHRPPPRPACLGSPPRPRRQ